MSSKFLLLVIAGLSYSAGMHAQTNTKLGTSALPVVTSGVYNTAIGNSAMFSTTTGRVNTAVGASAMYFNTSGYYNTAVARYAMYHNTSGYYNTASGYACMFENSTGSYNTASGNFALRLNMTGSYNTATGSEAMYSSTGSYCTGTGYQALYKNKNSYSTAAGAYALNSNTNGSFNMADGFASLYLNSTGSYNTGIGSYSGYSNGTGSGNTAVGYFADFSSLALTNASVIGYNAIATSSNQVMLGNLSVTSVKAASSVVLYSDGRYKKNLKENVPGLEFINQLKPVTYNYDIHGINKRLRGTGQTKIHDIKGESARLEEEAMVNKEKIVYTGLIAQDVEAAAKKLDYDFSGVYRPASDKDVYGLSYADFVVPLIKAVQELSHKNEELESRLQKVEELLARTQLNNNPGASLTDAVLQQNSPNPFKGSTVIRYFIPQSTASAAVVITNVKGQVIKRIPLSSLGNGQVRIDGGTLAAGSYTYSLNVDGKQIDTKQMLIIR